MRKLKKFVCLLLAMVLTLSMVPMFAAASETTEATTDETEAKKTTYTIKVKVMVGATTLYTYNVTVGDKPVTLSDSKYITYNNKYYKYSVYKVGNVKKHTVTIPAYDGSTTWENKWGKEGYIQVYYTSHSHSYKAGYNRIYHWSICACGDTTNEVRHVDPATDADKICTCGYTFNNNAQLSTLWLANMNLSPRFTRDVTEYVGEVVTYMDVTSTSITARPYDALSKIELPEDLTIREGANKFEIHVTAEDKTTTQTYTVIAVKPVTVENTLIGTDMTTVSAKLKVTLRNQAAYCAVSDAVSAKMLELAAADHASQLALCPDYSKWGPKQTEVTLTAAQLKTFAEESEADLLVKTPNDVTLTIPHAELAPLAEGHETVVLRVAKDGTFAILADDEEIIAPESVTVTLPEDAA